MPTYDLNLKRTASQVASVGNLVATAVVRRAWVWDVVFGCDAAAADNTFSWRVQRCTTTGTGTAVVPIKRDPADAACTATARENHTVEPTYTANEELLEFGMNQRATFRWQVDPKNGWVIPATAASGIGWQTPVAPAVICTVNIAFEE